MASPRTSSKDRVNYELIDYELTNRDNYNNNMAITESNISSKTLNNKFMNSFKRLNDKYTTNIYFVVSITFTLSIIIGIIFYSYYHEWELSTSFYFASQALLGNMYGMSSLLTLPILYHECIDGRRAPL